MSGEIVGVTGGSAGLAATYAEVRVLADHLDREGDRLRDHAATALRLARDGELVESALLSPVTCAAAEEAVLSAATAIGAASLAWEVDAVAVRGAITCLEHADDVVRLSLRGVELQLVVPTIGACFLDPDLIEDHPGLAEGALNSLAPLGVPFADAFGSPGPPAVAPYPATLPTDQPTSVGDLMAHLQEVAGLSLGADSPGNGTIEVQTVTGADGQVRHIVYLPGTDDFLPGAGDGDVRDLGTDAAALAGLPDAYQQGILDALAQAGVGPDDPVLVVGHSLGGMEAAALAADHHGFNITDVVTAGAPTAQVGSFPSDVNVLSLEQLGDLVPLLDGQPNPDSLQQTTVTVDTDPASGIHGHHLYDSYVPAAELVDQSDDPSVVGAVQSMHHHGYLGTGGTVSSQVFQITR